MFQFIQKTIEYYKQREVNEKYLSTAQGGISHKEREFYRSILGFTWVWIRLLVLKHCSYNFENYEKEMNQFVD